MNATAVMRIFKSMTKPLNKVSLVVFLSVGMLSFGLGMPSGFAQQLAGSIYPETTNNWHVFEFIGPGLKHEYLVTYHTVGRDGLPRPQAWTLSASKEMRDQGYNFPHKAVSIDPADVPQWIDKKLFVGPTGIQTTKTVRWLEWKASEQAVSRLHSALLNQGELPFDLREEFLVRNDLIKILSVQPKDRMKLWKFASYAIGGAVGVSAILSGCAYLLFNVILP